MAELPECFRLDLPDALARDVHHFAHALECAVATDGRKLARCVTVVKWG